MENISFEAPDGEITLVDNVTKHVWIDKGERDHLRPQVTFSVYTKDHQGIARSTADVKAKVEVVAVEARTARCRILEEDLTRPIAPGDPIYTPLWHSGMVEKIAFVGIIDLDGDGKSDRELLKEMMDINHSEIKLQILDDGTRSSRPKRCSTLTPSSSSRETSRTRMTSRDSTRSSGTSPT